MAQAPEITRAKVRKRTVAVQAHTRQVKQNPSAAAGDVASGQRYAALGRDIATKAYASKSLPSRQKSLAAARAAGPQQRTRTQRVFLDTHAQRVSPAGQARGALAKRYSSPLAGEMLARAHTPGKPAPITGNTIIKSKLKTDAKQAELLRASIAHAKAPWFNQPAKNAVNFTMTNLQRVSTGIGSEVKNRIGNPTDTLTGSSHGDSFKEGFLHPQEHAADWNDAVDAAGIHNKYVKGAVALTASIVTDPTTYVAFGTTTLAKEAGALAARKALTSGVPLEEALRAGRAAAEATGKAGEKRGVTVGVRGHVVRKVTGKRQVMTKPLSGPTRVKIEGAISKGATKLNARRVRVGPALGDVHEGARKFMMNPNVRPRGWKDYDYEIARQAGNTGRAMERTAQRQSDALAHALQKTTKNWTPDEHLQVHKALESKDLSGLAPHQRPVAEMLQRQNDMWYNTEPGRKALGPNAKVGFAEPPKTPAIPNPVDASSIVASRRTLAAAVKKMRAADTHAARWTAPGTRLKPGSQAHLKAQRAAGRARQEVKIVAQQHNALKGVAGRQRKVIRQFTRDTQAYDKAPAGYTARRIDPVSLTGENAGMRPSGRGPVIGNTVSYKTRQAKTALEHMDPADLEKYDFNLASSYRDRGLEHGRIMAAQEQHKWMAGLADPIHLSVPEAKALKGDNERRLFVRDDMGVHPAYNTQTGEVDTAKLVTAINQGHEVSEIDPSKFQTIQNLVKGGQRGAEHDPADLMRPLPGEARENFIKRAQRSWKWWATAPNPSYHLRNAVGDTFNALLAGTTSGDFRKAFTMNRADAALKSIEQSIGSPEGSRALEVLRTAAGRTQTYPAVGNLSDLEVMGLANKYGAINSGIISGELRELQSVGSGPVVDKLHLAPARDAIQKVGDYRENIARLATFHNGLVRGMTGPEAAAYSLRHHIDYSNLSRAEVAGWRYVVPFWTWWSRNLPLQVRGLGANPGLYANVEKARRQSLITAGIDPNVAESMGDTDQENLPWGTPFKSGKTPIVAGPGLSYMDLGTIPVPQTDWNTTLRTTGSDLVGRVNPFVKTGFEELTGVNPYTLQQHEQHNEGKYQTAPSFLPAGLPGIKRKYNKKTGKFETQANWRINSALNTVPFVNRLGKVSAPESMPGKATPGMQLGGWLTGPKYSPIDPNQLKLNQLYDQRAQIDSWITEHKGDYKHAAGATWTGPIGKAYKARSKVQKLIDGTSKSMGFKNVKSAGRPKKAVKPFGAAGGGSGTFGAGG